MADEQPLPADRALLLAELSNETARKLVAHTGLATDEAEMTTLIADAMKERLKEVEKELDDAPPEVA